MLRLILNNSNRIINKPSFTIKKTILCQIKTTSFLNNNNYFQNKRFFTSNNNNNNNNNEFDSDIKKIVFGDSNKQSEQNVIEIDAEKNKFLKSISDAVFKREQPEELKLILEKIKNNPNQPFLYYELFIWMNFVGGSSVVSKMDGTDDLISQKDALIKEISNNPNFINSYLYLSDHMQAFGFEEVEIATYISKDNKTFTNSTTNSKTTKYKYLDILLIILDIDKFNNAALDKISNYMLDHERDPIKFITLLNGDVHTMGTLIRLNYMVNKDVLPSSYIKLVYPFSLSGFIPKLNEESGEIVPMPFEELLCNGLIKFPNSSNIYEGLANILKHNYQGLSIPNVDLEDFNPNDPSHFKQMNRIDLMVKAIELLEKTLNYNEHNALSMYYHKLGKFLESKHESVYINGIPYYQLSLFTKAIELNLNNSYATVALIECMEPQQTVLINNRSFTRELLCTILNKVTSCLYLSKIYLQENKLEESKKFKNYYLHYKDEFHKNFMDKYSKEPMDYHNLAIGLNDGDKVVIDNKEMNKFDCILKAIDLCDNFTPMQPHYHYLLSKYLKDNHSTIKLLNGQEMNKRQLLITELAFFNNNIEAMYSFQIENNFNFDGSNFDVANGENNTPVSMVSDQDRVTRLLSLFSIDKNNPQINLDIGILLQENSEDNVNITLLDTNYLEDSEKSLYKLNRKELFIKYLLLKDPIYPEISNDTLLGWYHLSLELKYKEGDNQNNEIQFGKSRKQILLEIIELDDQFSRAYFQLSNLLVNNNDEIKLINGNYLNKIQLLLKAIDLETGYSDSKIASLIALSKCLSNNKMDKIDLLNGKRYNKQQLLIEIYEDYSSKQTNNFLFYIYQELSNTFEDDNELITLKGYQFSKNQILKILEENYKIILNNQHSPFF